MRYLLLALLLTGCTSAGTTQPLTQRSTLEGSGVIGSVMVGFYPVTYPVKWSGSGTVTLSATAPYVVTDGQLVIEPIPPFVIETQRSLRDGRMVVLRAGRPTMMVSPGTIPTGE